MTNKQILFNLAGDLENDLESMDHAKSESYADGDESLATQVETHHQTHDDSIELIPEF
jgi:hypothetical protein